METQVNVMGRRASIILLLFSIFTFMPSAFAIPMVHFTQNRTGSHEGLILEPRISLYSTSENFDSASRAIPLGNDASISQMLFDLAPTYGFNEDWFLFGRISVLSIKAQSSIRGERSATGLGDQLLGLSHRLVNTESGFSLNVQGEATLPAYQNANQKLNGDPYLGDQSTDLSLGVFGEIPLSLSSSGDWYLEAGASYQFRSRGYSANIPYSLLLKKDPALRGLVLTAGLMGVGSLNTDKTSPLQAAQDSMDGANGSLVINAVNPSYLGTHLQLGYKNNAGQVLYGMMNYPLSGTNQPKGMMISIGAIIDFGPHEKIKDQVAEKTRSRTWSTPSTKFTSYDLEAKVLSVADEFYVAKINKGSDEGIEKGQIFDIFKSVEDPVTQKRTETRIAKAKVSHLKENEAALTVLEYYVDQWIEEGFTARRELR